MYENPDDRPDAEVPKTKWWQAVLGWLVILAVFSLFIGWDWYTFGLNTSGFL